MAVDNIMLLSRSRLVNDGNEIEGVSGNFVAIQGVEA
jgi:hypothetical protein